MMDAPRKKVLLVDDHAILRAGLAALINGEPDLVVCGEADNERAALEVIRSVQPDVAIVDWTLGCADAADLVGALRSNSPPVPVLVLSMHDEVHYAERAIRAGAMGYVMKREAPDKVIEAIRAVIAGRAFLSEMAAKSVGSVFSWR